MAMEPLPETGRNKVSGITSGGNPRKAAAGRMAAVNKSNAPEAFSMVTAVIKPIKAGAIDTVDFIPSFAPSKKVSNKGTFLRNPKRRINAIKMGIS